MFWFVFCIKISIDDWRFGDVYLKDLCMLLFISYIASFLSDRQPNYKLISYLFLLIVIAEAFYSQCVMGRADFIFLFSLNLFSMLSIFSLGVSGLIGIVFYFMKKKRTIPFIPCLFLGSVVCHF